MKCLPLASSLILALLSSRAWASEFQYFGSDIDYWSKNEPKTETVLESKAETKEAFPWRHYMDPARKEFFREGEYTPPEPFMEIVRNPSDENLRMWTAYIQKRNSLVSRLKERLLEYSQKTGTTAPEGKDYLKARAEKLPEMSEDKNRFRFRMYFDSKCPHCKRMFSTLEALQTQGFYVEALQVDNDPSAIRGLPIPVRKASREDVQEKGIKSVPYLLVGDLKNRAVYALSGYQSVASIARAISNAPKPGGGL
jgi:glutaredoxin